MCVRLLSVLCPGGGSLKTDSLIVSVLCDPETQALMAPRARSAGDIPWCGLRVPASFSRVVQEPRAGRTRGKYVRRSSSLATRGAPSESVWAGRILQWNYGRVCGSGKLAHFGRISVEPGTGTSTRSWKSKGARQVHSHTRGGGVCV